jgi:hypothetical protein
MSAELKGNSTRWLNLFCLLQPNKQNKPNKPSNEPSPGGAFHHGLVDINQARIGHIAVRAFFARKSELFPYGCSGTDIAPCLRQNM